MKAIGKLFALPIHICEPTEAESSEALELAVDYFKSHYDMSYVRLAVHLDCQWCTADLRVVKSLPRSFPAGRILPLSSLREPL